MGDVIRFPLERRLAELAREPADPPSFLAVRLRPPGAGEGTGGTLVYTNANGAQLTLDVAAAPPGVTWTGGTA